LYFSEEHTQLQHESAEHANSRSHIFFFPAPSDFNLKRHLADAMALPPAIPLLSYSKISWSSFYVCDCLLPSQKRKMAELMICVFFQNAVLAEIWGYRKQYESYVWLSSLLSSPTPKFARSLAMSLPAYCLPSSKQPLDKPCGCWCFLKTGMNTCYVLFVLQKEVQNDGMCLSKIM
jgi:hypothetical protein